MTFNLWKYSPTVKNSTGGWEFLSVCKAVNEEEAIKTAQSRHGLTGPYKAYEAI